MAVLAQAIRASETETAAAMTPDGTTLVVQRVIGKEEPDSQESYVVHVTRKGAPGEQIEVTDLLEVILYMRDLRLDDFDPECDSWQPGLGHQPAVDATPHATPHARAQ